MRRQTRLKAALILFAMLAAFAASAGYILVVDSPQPSDVIVVLAGETDRRPQRAVQLLDHGYARKIILNVPAEARSYGVSEIELAQRYVQQLPEAASIVICPIEGLSTRDESHDAQKCLRPEDGDRVMLVTSDFHTRRALSIFRHELPSKNFAVAAARDDREFGEHWWMHRQWAKTCAAEWVRYLWWNAVDRWR
jgi:uncharacterized SAM-binding protein YcdF (DUF218 family)